MRERSTSQSLYRLCNGLYEDLKRCSTRSPSDKLEKAEGNLKGCILFFKFSSSFYLLRQYIYI